MIDLNNLTSEEKAMIEARREYKRKWRAANPDKVARHNKNFYEKLAKLKEGEKN